MSNNVLVIIDPQNDFLTLENSSLGVPGSVEDTDRLMKFISTHSCMIDRIVVSQDDHPHNHISLAGYWKDAKTGEPFVVPTTVPAPSFYKLQMLEDHTYMTLPMGGSEGDDSQLLVPRDENDNAKTVEYFTWLEKNHKSPPIIWPDHCVNGTFGQKVYAPLQAVLDNWEESTNSKVEYVPKGVGRYTDAYSVFEPEWSPWKLGKGTPTDRIAFNKKLASSITLESQKVIFAGQALSHCVQSSLKHYVEYLYEMYPNTVDPTVYLLTDTTSPVPGFGDSAQICKTLKSETTHGTNTNHQVVAVTTTQDDFLDAVPRTFVDVHSVFITAHRQRRRESIRGVEGKVQDNIIRFGGSTTSSAPAGNTGDMNEFDKMWEEAFGEEDHEMKTFTSEAKSYIDFGGEILALLQQIRETTEERQEMNAAYFQYKTRRLEENPELEDTWATNEKEKRRFVMAYVSAKYTLFHNARNNGANLNDFGIPPSQVVELEDLMLQDYTGMYDPDANLLSDSEMENTRSTHQGKRKRKPETRAEVVKAYVYSAMCKLMHDDYKNDWEHTPWIKWKLGTLAHDEVIKLVLDIHELDKPKSDTKTSRGGSTPSYSGVFVTPMDTEEGSSPTKSLDTVSIKTPYQELADHVRNTPSSPELDTITNRMVEMLGTGESGCWDRNGHHVRPIPSGTGGSKTGMKDEDDYQYTLGALERLKVNK
ncbi:MAG: hypothetical protein ACTSUE_19835, partial [Promethearchaeota archaeon]